MPGGYFTVSAHREENIDDQASMERLVAGLNAVAEAYRLPLVVSTHPRTRQMIDQRRFRFDPLITLIKPIGFIDYIKLQTEARAVLSDSGTISEEASILGFPALNLREAHERPEAMEEAAVIMTGLGRERILQGLKLLEEMPERTLQIPADYRVPNVSEKILRIVLSYTDYVNRTVWGKRPTDAGQ